MLFRTPGRITILDDAGRHTSLVPPPDSWPKGSWRMRSRDFEDPSRRAEFEIARFVSITYGVLIGLSLFYLSALSRWLLAGIGLSGTTLAVLASLLAIMLTWPAYVPLSRAHRKSKSSELRTAYLRAGKCPSCAFDLRGLPPEHDSLTRCPECSARWELPQARGESQVPHSTP